MKIENLSRAVVIEKQLSRYYDYLIKIEGFIESNHRIGMSNPDYDPDDHDSREYTDLMFPDGLRKQLHPKFYSNFWRYLHEEVAKAIDELKNEVKTL